MARIQPLGSLALAVAAMLGCAGPADAQAVEARHHVAIFGSDFDPWTGGRALWEERDFRARTPDLRVKVDPELSPLPALAQALGVPFEPPRIGYAELAGEVHGYAAFNFGYTFGAGELSVIYPMTTQIRIDSRADNDILAAGHTILISTAFEPGLPQPLSQPLCGSAAFRACFLSDNARKLLGSVHRPNFQTTFADARAYADFEYDIGAGIAATVGIAKVGNQCFSCFERRFKLRDARVVPLIDVSPQSVFVAGLGRKDLFPATFATPYGSIFADLPQPEVRMERMEGAGMSGEVEPTIIAFEAAVEKLVPVIGPLLSNNVGPLGYTLVETQGGPRLNLVQSFRFAITPMVTLRFSHPVALEQQPGSLHHELTLPLGHSVRIVAPEGARGPFAITPVYWLDARVKNSTRLALGLGVTARVLKLSLAGVGAGPFGQEHFQQSELFGQELCCAEFELRLPKATTEPIRFTLAGMLEGAAHKKLRDSNYQGLEQPLPTPEDPRGTQQIPDSRLQQPSERNSSQYGSEQIAEDQMLPEGISQVPPQATSPMLDNGRQSGAVVQQDPSVGTNTLLDVRRGPSSTRPGTGQRVRRQGAVRGQTVARELLERRGADVNLGTSPAITDGSMTVYVAGIPNSGMRTMSATPSATIRPRDMTPQVLHAFKEMGELENVSTTSEDPRVAGQLERSATKGQDGQQIPTTTSPADNTSAVIEPAIPTSTNAADGMQRALPPPPEPPR